jgi:hypothetical protein
VNGCPALGLDDSEEARNNSGGKNIMALLPNCKAIKKSSSLEKQMNISQ